MYNACIFILSNDRADTIKSTSFLEYYECKYPYYVVVDDEDPQLKEYKEKFGEKLIVFNKKEMRKKMNVDMGDNFDKYHNCVIIRNGCFYLAEKMGYDYFLELDDDYTRLSYKVDLENTLKDVKVPVKDFNKILDIHLELLEKTPVKAIAFGQAGDFIGGVNSSLVKNGYKRKLMNFIFFKTKDYLKFSGTLNDDVTCYAHEGNLGNFMFTSQFLSVTQPETQEVEGGLTTIYDDMGTYVKSFYSILYQPSSIKIATFAGSNKDAKGQARIHHHVYFNESLPKLISEKYKKQ